jgi:hypothetical protein
MMKKVKKGFKQRQNIEVENCRLTKSSGWVDVEAVLWIAYCN